MPPAKCGWLCGAGMASAFRLASNERRASTKVTMPPATFIGMVTKVGAMQKTVTVTVSRTVVHAKTGKVRLCYDTFYADWFA